MRKKKREGGREEGKREGGRAEGKLEGRQHHSHPSVMLQKNGQEEKKKGKKELLGEPNQAADHSHIFLLPHPPSHPHTVTGSVGQWLRT